MIQKIGSLGICLILWGCSASDYQSLARAALSKDPSTAAKIFASTKSIQYAKDPMRLEKDLKSIEGNLIQIFDALAKAVGQEWGANNTKESSRTEVVKYLNNYQSRVSIDFDKGIITVESIAQKEIKKELEDAIVTTLLLPDDPRQVDLFTSREVTLGGVPYLYGEVVDLEGKAMRWEWRARQYAQWLVSQKMTQRTIERDGKPLVMYGVRFGMVKDHASVRVAKVKPWVKAYAKKHQLSENLVYAIIKTESNFNQFAISRTGAVGLMQIMPNTAGRDAYEQVKGKAWIPTKEYLFDPAHNIELGSAYLKLIATKYLAGIEHEVSKEYCVISAYNGGSGTVLRTFDANRDRAKEKINALSPASVYKTLSTKVPYEETRRYLIKVLTHKKEFIRL